MRVVSLSSAGARPGEPHEVRRTLPGHSAVCAAILLIAGGFHLYRGVPEEAVVFCAAGLAVAADGMGWLPHPRTRRPRLPGPTMSLLLGGLGAIALSVLQIRGNAETLVVATIGAAAVALAWWQPDEPVPGRPEGSAPTAWAWAGIGLALCLSQLTVYLLADPPRREFDYPTLTYLWQPIVDQPGWRAVLLTLWLILGFALLRLFPTARPEQAAVAT
jgi:hypothetical protein